MTLQLSSLRVVIVFIVVVVVVIVVVIVLLIVIFLLMMMLLFILSTVDYVAMEEVVSFGNHFITKKNVFMNFHLSTVYSHILSLNKLENSHHRLYNTLLTVCEILKFYSR